MKRTLVWMLALAAAALLTVSTAVVAGEAEHAYTCSEEAQVCLNMLAAKLEGRGWAGVEMGHGESGPTVNKVHAGTPADRAGVQVGDVLLAINGVKLSEENHEKLAAMESEMKPGKSFSYTISHKGKERDVRFALEAMPVEIAAQTVGRHMLEHHTTVEVASAE